MKPTPLLVFAALIPVGCSRNSSSEYTNIMVGTQMAQTALSTPPEIMSESAGEFRDFVFFLSSIEQTKDGRTWLRATGLHEGNPVGMVCILDKTWEPGPPVKDMPSVKLRYGIARIETLGEESDALLQAMAKEFKLEAPGKKFVPAINLAVTSLEGDPAKLMTEPVKLKMFFESSKKFYAQFFVNVDAKNKRLVLGEKDLDYRKDLLAILSGAAK